MKTYFTEALFLSPTYVIIILRCSVIMLVVILLSSVAYAQNSRTDPDNTFSPRDDHHDSANSLGSEIDELSKELGTTREAVESILQKVSYRVSTTRMMISEADDKEAFIRSLAHDEMFKREEIDSNEGCEVLPLQVARAIQAGRSTNEGIGTNVGMPRFAGISPQNFEDQLYLFVVLWGLEQNDISLICHFALYRAFDVTCSRLDAVCYRGIMAAVGDIDTIRLDKADIEEILIVCRRIATSSKAIYRLLAIELAVLSTIPLPDQLKLYSLYTDEKDSVVKKHLIENLSKIKSDAAATVLFTLQEAWDE